VAGNIAGTAPIDPTRIAAQIVSGIGFLGAGAILKDGVVIRGLTTAASLWATAAVGMAVGAGWWLVAIVTAAIVVFSLWPLNRVMRRIRSIGEHQVRVRIATASLDSLGDLRRAVDGRRIEVSAINSQRQAHGRQEIELLLNVPTSVDQAGLLDLIQAVPGVEVLEMDSGGE
jgi:putative Mg2+ transporter-C (MgtC) family protein